MTREKPTVDDTQRALSEFAHARDWEKFHTPKNLVMALSGEVGELAEIFQWLTAEESASLEPESRERATDEIADVAIYLFRLATVLDIDLLDAVQRKIVRNEARYPADAVRGSARKRRDAE